MVSAKSRAKLMFRVTDSGKVRLGLRLGLA
jgi:hypothetical protein